MRSVELLKNISILYKNKDHSEIEINYISDNTLDIRDNTCFICIKGKKFDSHDLIKDFPQKPSLIIAEKHLETDIPYVIVESTAKVLPILATRFYDYPSEKLNLIGVTGTDGKTTTAIIVKQIIDHFTKCAYIGTNGFLMGEKKDKNPLTTPKPIKLNHFLHEAVTNGIHYASIEASSQGIDDNRIDQLHFKVAIFTNLTHEHLDYHKTIENYFHSKLKLFQMLTKDNTAVINIDSPYGARIIENTKAKIITYGTSSKADFMIHDIKTSLTKTEFNLKVKESTYPISLNLFGDYNVYNATAALCSCYALGFKLEDIIHYLNELTEIEGRMHIVECGQPFTVVVDFAHTPNALYCLLKNINSFKTNNITVVFGSAGERDRLKRPIMGEVVNQYASSIILTTEDPKTEDELEIIHDILKGIPDVFKVSIILNRKKAITQALENAQKGDIVLITGKGNEKIQMFNGYIEEHNDINIAEQYLHKMYQNEYIYSIANM